MFVVISFGILALVLVGAFVIWFYELFYSSDIKKDINKNNEEVKKFSLNDRILLQDKLYNDSECEELLVIEKSDCSGNVSLHKKEHSSDN
ncbi:Hypothetical protein SRAE_X000036100 [Strongyloides ratti]|uniref:Uncharacterized protein n=1 Tax=Strongyloides ratti TaxID=34506 RepID=A0A090LTR4_STRRB|nr:Hypothetical protein SRAE_X000036100 [Strongyloides ratti]CEF71034.1 Hypothetical protein SRAE_X000036100 [Strongyloides ratti]